MEILVQISNHTYIISGAFKNKIINKNILYYHTELWDIVYDPFAGGGTTVDACKKWFRRYYCSDKKVVQGREKEIKINYLIEDIFLI